MPVFAIESVVTPRNWESKLIDASGKDVPEEEIPRTSGLDERPYLVILKNGPIHSVDDYVGPQLLALSGQLRGELWATGSKEIRKVVGAFKVNIVQQAENDGTVRWIRGYSRTVTRRMQELRSEGVGPVVVISYDPLKNGLLGASIRRRHGWPLILELNGAFNNPHNYGDQQSLLGRRLKPWVFRRVAQLAVNRADGIRLLYDEQMQNFVAPPPGATVRRFFDSVPLDRFPPGAEEFTILHAGYPFRRKGVDLLLQAFDQLKADFPQWQLVLIGHQLQEQIPDPPDRVVVLKAMHNQQIAQWISRCGCFVLASRSEAMGRVLIEAAAAGKARVVSRVDGTYTVVSDEVDGLMFEPEDVDALVRQLRRVLSDPALRRRLGSEARQRAYREFSEKVYAEHVSEMVGAVLGEARASSVHCTSRDN